MHRFNWPNIIKGALLVIFLYSLGYFMCYYTHSIKSPRPKMTFIIKYKQVPPIIQDFPRVKIKTYYRGLYIGDVSKINFSDDQKYVLFYVNIFYDKLKLPINTYVELNTEDLYGARHFALYYPQNPSSTMLKDGDVIYGDAAYERIDKFLVRDMTTGKTGRLISNLADITDSVKNLTNNLPAKDSQELIAGIKRSSGEAQLILSDIRQILDDPETKEEIKSIIKSSSGSIRSIDEVLRSKQMRQTISNAPLYINKTINSLEVITEDMPKINKNLDKTNVALPQVNESVSTTNCLLSRTNSNLDCINSKVPKIPDIPPDLMPEATKALKKTNCILDELPRILSQRFLALRFIFGNPAKSLKKCSPGHCSYNTSR